MKVLVLGNGGREHALCWRAAQSKLVDSLYCAPGNPGTATIANNVDIAVDDIPALIAFVKREDIGLTIVGPEAPLSKGIVDQFEKEGLCIFGPSKAAAQLEVSKNFAKEAMIAAGVPTAQAKQCHSKNDALAYMSERGAPIVIKADGLAAGKGVVVCLQDSEIAPAVDHVFDTIGANEALIEDYLEGVEASFIVATDGTSVVPMATSHDYKRLLKDDQGPNTGGMGSVSPTPRLTIEQENWAVEHIIQPVLQEMSKRGAPFKGFLYAGLMISPGGDLSVVEFNVRMGDPECQSIMRRAQFDFIAMLLSLIDNKNYPMPEVTWSAETSICVVLASQGYPESSSKGDAISGLDQAAAINDAVVFHAGTGLEEHSIVTAGGRVLGVTCMANDLDATKSAVFKAADMIQFRGRQIRRDIGE